MEGLILIGHYLVSLYASVVLLRFLAQWLGADFRNPISKAIIQLTNPPLLPLRRVIPGWKGKDIASLVLLILVICAEAILLALLYKVNNPPVVIAAIAYRCFNIVLNTYFFMLIITAIASWVNQDPYNPVQLFFGKILSPLLMPLRKRIPPLGGALDLTPMILLIGIYFLQFQGKIWFFNGLVALLGSNNIDLGLHSFLGWMLA